MDTLEFAYMLRDLADGYIAATRDAAYWQREAETWRAKYDALLDESFAFPHKLMADVLVTLIDGEAQHGR